MQPWCTRAPVNLRQRVHWQDPFWFYVSRGLAEQFSRGLEFGLEMTHVRGRPLHIWSNCDGVADGAAEATT